MASPKVWIVINFSLGVLALLLILTLFDVTLPSLGQAQYVLDRESPLCLVEWKGQHNVLDDINTCCLEARKQLTCVYESVELELGRVDWNCKTGSGSVLSYELNNKAYRYCQQQNYW